MSVELLDTFPHFAAVIELCKTTNRVPEQHNHFSLISILNNICANLNRSKNNYHYSSYVTHFALSLFIYPGRNAYRLVSLNVPGLFPSITTVRKTLANSSFRVHEAQFRFEAMADHFALTNSTLAFAAEDCTSVITKVVYDTVSNSFVGFTTPMRQGTPQSNYHQTDSFTELQRWFKEKQKSTSVNIHMVQPVPSPSSTQAHTPMLLSAYGVDGTFTAEDVLNRWRWICEETKKKGIRILGFSTDCDPRYLRSMRIASGFFVSSIDPRFQTHPDAFEINIPQWQWFFLSSPQLCFFMQTSGSEKWQKTLMICWDENE